VSARTQRSPEDQRRADLARIHILKKDIGFGDEEYRNFMLDNFWSSSSADLTADERRKFIGLLAKKLEARERGIRTKKKPQSMADFPTPEQKGKIDALANDIKWREGKVRGLKGYCLRMLGVAWPQSIGEASRLIEYLKKMKETQQRKAGENV